MKSEFLVQSKYDQIICKWNETCNHYPKYKTVTELFQEQVIKTPDNIALVFGNKKISYKTLDEKSNQLARYIRSQYKQITNQDLKPDTFIPLCLERSLDMVIAILAVMKAGGAYVPMDSEYPESRFKHMLSDTEAKLIITQTNLSDKLTLIIKNLHREINLIPIDSTLSKQSKEHSYVYDHENKKTLEPQNKATDLACVIYTSGTTGMPKGVMIEHKNINSLVFNDKINTNKKNIYVFLSSPVFDASIFEIFSSLLLGCKLIIPKNPKELISNICYFKEFLAKNKISILWLTKTLFDSIYTQDPLIFKDLKYLIIGGEALDKVIINMLVANSQKPKNIINGYGPTESTTFTTFYNFEKIVEQGNYCPIGKPINNRKTYVLSQSNKDPVPIGEVGELYIGGAGLSRGYLNLPELTAERFVSNPFATKSDIENGYTRLYQTGDLVRWLPDGNLEYIGRNDFQIKIRGFRIELGEVEAQLNKLAGIKQSTVLAKENAQINNKYLVGYYVPEQLNTLKQDDLLNQLSKVLPDYMVPSVLVEIESFPLTINGKLDRKELPDPEFVSDDSYVAPGTELESNICDIWKELLGLEKVGIKDDFFRIGGNSLLLASFISICYKKYSYIIKFSDIISLQDKNIKNIAKKISYISNDVTSFTNKNHLYSIYDSQRNLIVLNDDFELCSSYNVQLNFSFTERVQPNNIYKAFNQLVSNHSILRTQIKFVNGEVVQKVIDNSPIEEHILKFQDKTAMLDFLMKEANSCFKTDDNLIRLYLIEVEDFFVLSFNLHHLLIDSWSVKLITEGMSQEYSKIQEDNNAELTNQYHYQELFKNRPVLDQKIVDFWKNNQEFFQNSNTLAFAPPEECNELTFALNKQEINQTAFLLNTSVFSIVISIAQYILGKYLDNQNLKVAFPFLNRNTSQELDCVGFFANTLPFFNDDIFSKDLLLKEYLTKCYDRTNEIQENGELSYSYLSSNLGISAQTMFVLQDGKVEDKSIFFGECEAKHLSSQRSNKAKFPILIDLTEKEHQLSGYIQFTKVITSFVAASIVESMKYILENLSGFLSMKLDEIEIVAKKQYQNLLSYQESISDQNVINFVDAISSNLSDSVAVSDTKINYSYKELNIISSQISNLIIEKGVKNNDRVIVLMDNSCDMILAMLSILKAGATYVPIDVSLPENRINNIIEHSNPSFVLIDDENRSKLSKVTTISFKDIKKASKTHKEEAFVKDFSGLNSYIIYTSGSTGEPKAVLQNHQSTSSCLGALKKNIQLSCKDTVIQHTPISFDISIQEIFFPLYCGARLVTLKSLHRKDPYKIIDIIQREEVTTANFVPTMLSSILSIVENSDQELSSLKNILVGGENFDYYLVNLFYKTFPEGNFYNVYGPSEAFYVTCKKMMKNSMISLGNGIGEAELYVMNHNKLQMPGKEGELYISGKGLATGYYKNQKLTEEKFINLSVFGVTKRLYKTGDLVRWLSPDNLEYIDRIDFQVKINGNRVDLEEIKNFVVEKLGQKNVVVTKVFSNEKATTCIYSTNSINNEIKKELYNYLYTNLPEYMIPKYYKYIKNFPLNNNGKIDRKLLPKPSSQDLLLLDSGENKAPTTPVELELSKLIITNFDGEINIKQLDVNTSVEYYGVKSLASITYILSVNKVFDVNVDVSWFNKYKTIKEQADSLANLKQDGFIKRVAAKKSKESLIFIHPGFYGVDVYNEIFSFNSLKDKNLIKIDHYNLFYSKKIIINFNKLVDVYIENLIIDFDKNNTISLFGWSLGGKIALHIADKLVQKGYVVKNIYLLDSYYYNDVNFDLNIVRQNISVEIQKHKSIAVEHVFNNDIRFSLEKDDYANLSDVDVYLFKAIKIKSTSNQEIDDFYQQKYNGYPKEKFKSLKVFDIDSNHFLLLKNKEGLSMIESIIKLTL